MAQVQSKFGLSNWSLDIWAYHAPNEGFLSNVRLLEDWLRERRPPLQQPTQDEVTRASQEYGGLEQVKRSSEEILIFLSLY